MLSQPYFATNPILKEAKNRAPASEDAYHRYMSSGQGEGKTTHTKSGKNAVSPPTEPSVVMVAMSYNKQGYSKSPSAVKDWPKTVVRFIVRRSVLACI